MNWEIHAAATGADAGYGRTNIYAGGALSGGSYAIPARHEPPRIRLADYELYDINTATKAHEPRDPAAGSRRSGQPGWLLRPEYNLNDENSNELILGT